MAPQHDHEFSQLRIGPEGGAAAQMQLTDTFPWADMSHQQVHLTRKVAQVGVGLSWCLVMTLLQAQ